MSSRPSLPPFDPSDFENLRVPRSRPTVLDPLDPRFLFCPDDECEDPRPDISNFHRKVKWTVEYNVMVNETEITGRLELGGERFWVRQTVHGRPQQLDRFVEAPEIAAAKLHGLHQMEHNLKQHYGFWS